MTEKKPRCARKRCRKLATHAVVVFIPHPAQVKVCEPHADEAMESGSTSKIPIDWVAAPVGPSQVSEQPGGAP